MNIGMIKGEYQDAQYKGHQCSIERAQIGAVFVSFILLALHIVYPMIYPCNNTFS